MITLLNTIFSDRGELFAIGQGRRMVFAHCKPKISIYEKTTQIPVLGKQGYREKSMRFTIALCEDMEFTVHDVEKTIKKVERYELTTDIIRNDGIAERFYFHNIFLAEITSTGEWEFDLEATNEQMQKLLEIAGIQK